jgi:cysteinyl-tRNA synthetase
MSNSDLHTANSIDQWFLRERIGVEGEDRIVFKGEGEAEGKGIDDLIRERDEARNRKDWAESDRLRSELEALGLVIKDTRDGTTWEPKR